MALRKGQLPAALFRPALTLLRLLAYTHHCTRSPLLLQLQLVADLQEQIGTDSHHVVANLAVVHKQALQWETDLLPGALPEVLRSAVKKQVALTDKEQRDLVVLSVAATLGLHDLSDHREPNMKKLEKQPLRFVGELLIAAASAQKGRLLGPREVPVRRSQSISLLAKLPAPSEQEMQVMLALSYSSC